MRNEAKQLAALCVLLVAILAGAYLFRDGLGLVVFLILGLATLVQLFR
jgi:hypothetical protein